MKSENTGNLFTTQIKLSGIQSTGLQIKVHI